MKDDKTVIYFDGVCNLCNSSVRFILKWDKKKIFYFSPLQMLNKKEIEQVAHENGAVMDSIILQHKGKLFYGSEAALAIAAILGFPWHIVLVFKVLPIKIRQRLYRYVAKNRYKWFGKKEQCMVPSEEYNARFLRNKV